MMSLASIAQPEPDYETVLVLSDYLEESGKPEWAECLRWLMKRQKWPARGWHFSPTEPVRYQWQAHGLQARHLPPAFFFGGQREVWFAMCGTGSSSKESQLYLDVPMDDIPKTDADARECRLIEKALEYACRMWEVRRAEILFYLELTGEL